MVQGNIKRKEEWRHSLKNKNKMRELVLPGKKHSFYFKITWIKTPNFIFFFTYSLLAHVCSTYWFHYLRGISTVPNTTSFLFHPFFPSLPPSLDPFPICEDLSPNLMLSFTSHFIYNEGFLQKRNHAIFKLICLIYFT